MAAADLVITQVRMLTSRQQDLMGDWVRGVNRRRRLFTSIFPALERAPDSSADPAHQPPHPDRCARRDPGILAH